jgi:hypothetical protein
MDGRSYHCAHPGYFIYDKVIYIVIIGQRRDTSTTSGWSGSMNVRPPQSREEVGLVMIVSGVVLVLMSACLLDANPFATVFSAAIGYVGLRLFGLGRRVEIIATAVLAVLVISLILLYLL